MKVVLEANVSQIADLELARKRSFSGAACRSCDKCLAEVQADYLAASIGYVDSHPTRPARRIEDPLPLTQSEGTSYEGAFLGPNVIWPEPKPLVEMVEPVEPEPNKWWKNKIKSAKYVRER